MQQISKTDPEPPFVIALDVGTSSIRALLFDRHGNSLPGVLSQHMYKLTISEVRPEAGKHILYAEAAERQQHLYQQLLANG